MNGSTTRRTRQQCIDDVVKGNHILVRRGVLDSYGHISVRSPDDPGRFFLARAMAPATVEAGDIVELDLDGNPVHPESRKLYLERFIHGEIYRARPDVQAVVHSHSPTVIPFGISKVPMRPVCQLCGFIGQGVPLFEIRDAIGDGSDLLIRDGALGKSLAQSLGDKAVCLQRGHGAVTVGGTVAQVVGRSVYLELNARLQMQAITISGGDHDITYLSEAEIETIGAKLGDFERAWEAWCLEEDELA
jgi:HCOMODA/2-hydroxy-3-carboxy-muconic semialdehyde decarboxylase